MILLGWGALVHPAAEADRMSLAFTLRVKKANSYRLLAVAFPIKTYETSRLRHLLLLNNSTVIF